MSVRDDWNGHNKLDTKKWAICKPRCFVVALGNRWMVQGHKLSNPWIRFVCVGHTNMVSQIENYGGQIRAGIKVPSCEEIESLTG